MQTIYLNAPFQRGTKKDPFSGLYWCPKCMTWKAKNSFHFKVKEKGHINPYCKACQNALQISWIRNLKISSPEKYRKYLEGCNRRSKISRLKKRLIEFHKSRKLKESSF